MTFAILCLIRVYTVFHSQQSNQCLHFLSFPVVSTGSKPLAILSSLIKVKVYTVILRSSLIRVYTICQSQQSARGLHYFPFSAVCSGSTLFAILSLIRVYTNCYSQQSDHSLHCHSQQSDEGLHCLQFSLGWSGSTPFAILCSQIKFCTVFHSGLHYLPSQQSDKGLHYLPFSAVWSGSTLFCSLIKVYTVCHSQQSDLDLHYLPSSAVWSGPSLFVILS